ncbi:MAG: YraN family protein [Actinomycetota bacterium]
MEARGPRAELGSAGEGAALDWYLARGFRLVARNWRCPLGELDLIVRRGSLVAFVEVKTRAGSGFGGGYEAVGWRKQHKLRQLAEAFVARHGRSGFEYRFDVASVMSGRSSRHDVHVFEDAF